MLSATVFTRHAKYFNLSREDPALVSTGSFGRNYFHAVGDATALIFTSVIVVNTCYLAEPKISDNMKPVKVIEGALLEGEWERFVGAIGMIMGEDEFRAQLFKDYLSFSTIVATGYEGSSSMSFISLLIIFKPDYCCIEASSSKQGQSSPFTRRAAPSTNKTALAFHDIGM